MTRILTLEYSLEAVASVAALLALAGVLQTFLVGQHFVIPTMILMLVFFFGNLARFGYRDYRWAKHMLFWVCLLLVFHALFALVWAVDFRPGEIFGRAFYPLYGGFALIVGALCIGYARINRLFGRARSED
jgi:uncharacterized membrane protein